MKSLNRKLVRDLYGSKWLLLAVVSIVSVGVMSFVSMRSVYHNLQNAKRDYYGRCRMADFWIDVKKIPRAELRLREQLPQIAEIRARIGFRATVNLADVDRPINAMVVSLPDLRAPVINDVVMRRGTYFTGASANEAIVSDSFAKAHDLHPGHFIEVLLNNRQQPLRIVGTCISSEFTYMLGPGEIVPDPKNFGVLYVKQTYAEDVFDFSAAANQLMGRFTRRPGESDEQRVRRTKQILHQAEWMLEPFGVADAVPLDLQLSNQFLSNEIAGLGAFAMVVPAMFLAVAALVLNVLISRMARQQRTVVGTLKAIGYSDQAIFLNFLAFGICVGLCGALLGSLLGHLSATGMTAIYRQFFEFPTLGSHFHWYTHATGLTISLTCAIAGSLHGARAMLRLRPAEAMRPEPPKRADAILLERWMPLLWTKLSADWRMSLRGIFRARFRTSTGVFASCMGAAILACGLMMTESQYFLIDFQFERVTRSDIDLTFESERGRDALDEIGRLTGVEHVEPQLFVGCDFENGSHRRKGGITGLVRDARLTMPRNMNARPISIPGEGLILSRRLAETLHVTAGQSVTVIPVRGERRPVKAVVAKIADSYMGLSAYAEIGYLSRLVGEEYVVSGAQLTTGTDSRKLAHLHRELKRTPGIMSVVSRRDIIDNLWKAILESQWVFIVMLIVFSGVIFCGSIINASMVNLAERQREVATFLAIGYSPGRVGAIFLRESVLTNIAGTLLGLPCGYGLTWLIAYAYNNDLIRLPVISPPWVIVTTLAAGLVFVAVAHIAVDLRIRRLNYVDALKVQE